MWSEMEARPTPDRRTNPWVVAKRETGEAVDRAREIVSAAVGLRVATELHDVDRARTEAERIRTLIDG